jgi:hypothetical protein
MRGLWSALADGALRQAAFALDAAVFDLAYITGPVVASSLAAGLAPAAAVGLLIALTGAAIVIIGARAGSPAPGSAEPSPAGSGQASPGVASPGVAGSGSAGSGGAAGGQPATARRSLLGALNSGPLRRLLVTGALVNVALSATEVALTAYVRQRHALWASGPLLAEVSVGSIAGSLLLGARAAVHGASPAAAARRLPRLLACYALGLAVLAAAALQPPLIAVAAPLAGLCLGPSLATLFGLTPGRGPGRGTEAQAWLNSAMNGGAAAGAALAGATAGRPALSLAITAGVAAIAAVSGAGRSRGQPRTGPQRVASVVSSLLLRDVLR